jgi:hypothetical protein
MYDQNNKRHNTAVRVTSAGWIILAAAVILSNTLNAQSGPRPGAANPLAGPGKLRLFPDEELFSFSPDGNGKGDIVTRLYRTDNSSNLSLADAASLNVYQNHNSVARRPAGSWTRHTPRKYRSNACQEPRSSKCEFTIVARLSILLSSATI